ncbi:MAG TPA: VWA domain-containing protein, partial [Anaerolineaceae bacterium]|nr:VWA domain-containing protein [Anaerolineaceae bacterium]
MTLLWPGFYPLLGLIPLLIGIYIWALRRRRKFALRYSSLSLVREALPRYSFLRRHLPFALFILALTALILALGRPATIVSIPTSQTTIILSIDVSGSMRSADIPPTRLAAAEAAAISFVQRQKSSTQIGVVAFSGFADLVQPPTTDQDALESAIESLTTGRATAIGSGILEAIDAIADVDKNVVASRDSTGSEIQVDPVPKGVYAPDIIVLLTDGVSNAGPSPLDAAQFAVDRGVRVYTIGFGTANGSIPIDPQFQQGGGGGFFGGPGGFGGGGFGRGRFRTAIDETTLKQIAATTGGEYYTASSAGELQKVFDSLPTYLI